MSKWLFIIISAGWVWLSGCSSPARPTAQQLLHRAVFDLGCGANGIQFYRIDGRTMAVAGCGRRLVYVESCDSALGGRDSCTWLIDSPPSNSYSYPVSCPTGQIAVQSPLVGPSLVDMKRSTTEFGPGPAPPWMGPIPPLRSTEEFSATSPPLKTPEFDSERERRSKGDLFPDPR